MRIAFDWTNSSNITRISHVCFRCISSSCLRLADVLFLVTPFCQSSSTSFCFAVLPRQMRKKNLMIFSAVQLMFLLAISLSIAKTITKNGQFCRCESSRCASKSCNDIGPFTIYVCSENQSLFKWYAPYKSIASHKLVARRLRLLHESHFYSIRFFFILYYKMWDVWITMLNQVCAWSHNVASFHRTGTVCAFFSGSNIWSAERIIEKEKKKCRLMMSMAHATMFSVPRCTRALLFYFNIICTSNSIIPINCVN